MELLLFKTSLKTPADAPRLLQALNGAFPNRWNIDWHDAEKLLRFIGTRKEASLLVDAVQQHGFLCIEIEAELTVPMLAPMAEPNNTAAGGETVAEEKLLVA